MTAAIEQARRDGDSLGGIVTCVARGVPAGWGEPVFDKLEADLAKSVMSLPASKGFEIGSGFGSVEMTGKQHNDAFVPGPDGRPRTATNRSGGIQGGISNGEEINLRVAFKPTATISSTAGHGDHGQRSNRPGGEGPPRSVRAAQSGATGRGCGVAGAGRPLAPADRGAGRPRTSHRHHSPGHHCPRGLSPTPGLRLGLQAGRTGATGGPGQRWRPCRPQCVPAPIGPDALLRSARPSGRVSTRSTLGLPRTLRPLHTSPRHPSGRPCPAPRPWCHRPATDAVPQVDRGRRPKDARSGRSEPLPPAGRALGGLLADGGHRRRWPVPERPSTQASGGRRQCNRGARARSSWSVQRQRRPRATRPGIVRRGPRASPSDASRRVLRSAASCHRSGDGAGRADRVRRWRPDER